MDKNNNTLSEVRKTAAQRMWNAENKQRAKSDASNKRTPSSIPAPDKKLKSESATLAAAVIGGAALMRMHQKLKDKKDKQATEKPAKPVKEENVAEGYNDLDREYGGAGKGRSDDAIATARRTRQAKAAAKKAGKTFNTSAEYRLWHMKQKPKKQDVAEGAELKKAKRLMNQAAKDANTDQVGAGRKINTMKNSLRQKDVNKRGVAEGTTGAKPGWMLRQDPVLGSRVKAAQAKQNEFKKLVGTKVPVKPVKEARDPHEYDYEGEMAKGQLRTIIANAQRAHDMLEDDTNMAEWVQSKITLAADYISTVADYMQSEVNEDVEELDELSKSTLGSYIKKAADSATMRAYGAGGESTRHAGEPISKRPDTYGADRKVAIKRLKGIDKATDRLTKESKSFHDIRKELDEKHLTPAEKSKREEIAKAMHRENPGMPMAKKMAIATAAAEKSA